MTEDNTPAPEDIPARLEYLRGEIQAQRISYGELSELQGLAAHIPAWDVELLEWAGVPEFPEDSGRNTFTLTIEVTAENIPDGYTAADLTDEIRDAVFSAVTYTPLDVIVMTLTPEGSHND